MHDSIPAGYPYQKKPMARIDRERGDMSRSRFLMRLVQRAYGMEEKGANRLA